MKMSADELEYLISQYIDGTLNPLEQRVVEERLATDADAREMLRGYERLNGIVKSAMPLPEISWDDLAANIVARTAPLDLPVRHYRLAFGTISKFASVAAAILIAIGLVAKFHDRGAGPMNPVGSAVARVNFSPVQVQINGPAPVSNALAKVSIGAAPNYAAVDFHSAEAIISQPTSIWISSGSPAQQDTDATPY